MATPVQTAQLVRLALRTLAGDNAHHSFEHLCRQVAKRRIASNVLPATGPVSAGGDQGRDFETFRTYLADELPFGIGFLALASSDVVVFACTIQQDKLRAKFEEDVTAICTHGTHVDRIYIFATANVPTRLRHDLQDWTTQQYGTALEVVDGSALSELLAESDLYWIAEEYLQLPAELAPTPSQPEQEEQLPTWYVELRDYWQEPGRQPVNLGDLFDLRHGIRHAIPPGPARTDLAVWLTLMTRLVERTPDVEARLHAIYEIVAARSRGMADLRPAEPLIRRFITEIQSRDDPTLLFNSSLLIQFCTSAAALGLTDMTLDEVTGWSQPLRQHLERLLERDWAPNKRAGLLQAAAHLALHIDYSDGNVRGHATLRDIDRLYESVVDAVERGTLQSHLGPAPVVDLETGMRRLADLVELLPDAPAYPIGTFGMTVDVLAPILRDHPLYRQVCDGFDKAVARQEGDAAAGERCRQRAEALRQAGRPLDALREFHQAKINWFHGDILYATLLAMSNIVDIYSGLGMYLAAKRYALAMAALALGAADTSDRELVPIALFSAANMDHLAGAWVASAHLAAIAGQAHLKWAPDPDNIDRHAYVQEAMKYQAFAVVVAQETRPAFVPTLLDFFRGGLFDGFTHDRERPDAPPQSEAEWTDRMSDMAGAPFSDVGPRRVIAFHALGVRWTVHSHNEQDAVLALEDFTSTLQILLVEFASLDPVLFGQEVDIEVRVHEPGNLPADNYLTREYEGRRHWLLFVPSDPPVEANDLAEISQGNLHLAFQVLVGNSLLNERRFAELMEQAARNGLFSNIEIGRPYRELARFRDQPVPPLTSALHRPLANTQRPNPRVSASAMRPRNGQGPRYSTDRAHVILAERYEILPKSIQHTIPGLLANSRVRELFTELRAEGWKDWHLLNVVVNMTVNHRLTVQHGRITADNPRQVAKLFHTEAMREEEPDDPRIDADQITRRTMEQGIDLVAISSLHRWDLTSHHGTNNPGPIIQVLAERYGFWADDIPHPDPFHDLIPASQ